MGTQATSPQNAEDVSHPFAAGFNNASELMAAVGGEHSVPIDLDRIASFLHITVRYDASLEGSDVLSDLQWEGDRAVIRVNSVALDTKKKTRFAIAHELGHYCLHGGASGTEFVDSQKTLDKVGSFWNEMESSASSFACSLLMPLPDMIPEGQRIIDDLLHGNPSKVDQSEFITRMSDTFVFPRDRVENLLMVRGVINFSKQESDKESDGHTTTSRKTVRP